MARRKVNIQRNLGIKGSPMERNEKEDVIDRLAGTMSLVEIGFRPTNQRVYEIDLDRITPDPSQPRHLIPHDLRSAIYHGDLSPSDAIQELVFRAEHEDTVALLILGGQKKGLVEEEDENIEDAGLLALARSIREVGLRQPLNVYRVDDPEQSDKTAYRLGGITGSRT